MQVLRFVSNLASDIPESLPAPQVPAACAQGRLYIEPFPLLFRLRATMGGSVLLEPSRRPQKPCHLPRRRLRTGRRAEPRRGNVTVTARYPLSAMHVRAKRGSNCPAPSRYRTQASLEQLHASPTHGRPESRAVNAGPSQDRGGVACQGSWSRKRPESLDSPVEPRIKHNYHTDQYFKRENVGLITPQGRLHPVASRLTFISFSRCTIISKVPCRPSVPDFPSAGRLRI